MGLRERSSPKLGCEATISTVPLVKNEVNTSILEIIRNRLIKISSENPSCLLPLYEPMDFKRSSTSLYDKFCVVSKVYLRHNHEDLEEKDNHIYLHRISDVLEDKKIMKLLDMFLSIHPTGDACIMKASYFLESAFPNYIISEEILKNVIYLKRNNKYDAMQVVQSLRDEKDKGAVEYFTFKLHDENGMLKTLIWSFQGSGELVRKYGDLMFWDSTHEMTKYDYKLSTFNIVDSEGKSRSVMFNLTLEESTIEFQFMLQAWHIAFKIRIPSVVITDGDEAMFSSISSLKYSDEIVHLNCVFHILI